MSQKEQILSIIDSYIEKLNWSSTLEDIKEKIINEVPDDDWISVEDRLPERWIEVEIAGIRKYNAYRCKCDWDYCNAWRDSMSWCEITMSPTHWKPLPLPPSK